MFALKQDETVFIVFFKCMFLVGQCCYYLSLPSKKLPDNVFYWSDL